MSSVLANATRARSWAWPRTLWRELEAFGLCFAVVSLATTVFMNRAELSQDMFPLSQSVIVAFVVCVQLVPTVLLYVSDRLIERRWSARHATFRGVIFGLAPAVLLLHAVGAMVDGRRYIEDLNRTLLFVAIAVPVLWAPIRLMTWHPREATTLYRFLIPAALIPTVLTVAQDPAAGLPAASTAVVEHQYSEELPNTFVLVFDELSYPALLNDDGSIDSGRYPNIASLASQGATFTDASAHHFYSRDAVPELLGAVASLSDRADVSLYSQFSQAEVPFRAGCGVRYTCAGLATHIADDPMVLVRHMLVGFTWQATPGPLRSVVAAPREWFARLLGERQAASDMDGHHLFTERLFDTLIDDTVRAEPLGQVIGFHSMVTHGPYLFDGAGQMQPGVDVEFWTRGGDRDAIYQRYLEQIEFADAQLGRLLDLLRDSGRLDDSYVILTADHGLRRGEVYYYPPPEVLSTEPTHIPLIIRGPGIEPGTYDLDYSHVDFEATLRDVLGLPPSGVGISALSPTLPRARTREFIRRDEGVAWHYERQPGEDTWHLVRTEDLTTEDDTED